MVNIDTTRSRSALMSRIRGKDTSPELLIRKAAWAIGLRYRKHHRINRTKPDLVFLGPKVAVFVDGCFWHKCPQHFVLPKNNRDFWKDKLDQNALRDQRNTRELEKAGWKVLRFWEHEIEESPETCAKKIAMAIRGRKKISGDTP